MLREPPSILVVEDDEPVSLFIEKTLTRMGFRVSQRVTTAEEALEWAQIHKPDLVLMDIGLQGAMDGIRGAETMKVRLGLPVVFLTGYADEDRLTRARVTDAYGYLLKPFQPQELRSAIELALHKHHLSQQLRERERLFFTTLRSIADAVMAATVDERITFMNPVAELLTGTTQQAALGRPLSEVYRTLNEENRTPAQGPWLDALQGQEKVGLLSGPRLLLRADGAQTAVEDSASLLVDEVGAVLGVVLVFRDITQRRRLEQRLAVSERLASLGTLAAGFAHEVNNPMAYVLANVEFCSKALHRLESHAQTLLVDEVLPPLWGQSLGEVSTALREAQEGALRVCRIVADVKSLSRPDVGAAQWLDVRDVLDSAVKMTQSLHPVGATVVRDYQQVPLILANESRLGQLFLNLLLNAAQAMPANPPPGQIQEIRVVTSSNDAGAVVVEVVDTGVGIAQDALRRVFDPFFTTKASGQGTGLGLSICHRIVTDLGGEISVESQPGKRTVFCVVLPTK